MRKTPEINTLPLVQAAIYYAQLGWAVFPLHGKMPYKDFHWRAEATTDPDNIAALWTHYKAANIGLPTGSVSGVIVLDIDPRHQGHLSIKELERRHGKLPDTRTSRTAHGGLHRFYQHPNDSLYPNTTRLDGLTGLDVRSDGGYVVLPPSKLYNRLSYLWGRQDFPLAPAPAWLLTLLTKGQERLSPQGWRVADSPGQKWLTEALTQGRVGNRNHVGFLLALQLRDDGFSEAEARDMLLIFASQMEQGKEPYTTKEALASVRSAYSRPPRERARRTP